MNMREFHNALRILHSIDSPEFYRAAHPKKGKYILPMPDEAADWQSFHDNPVLWFIKAPDAAAYAIWKLIEGRQP